MIGNRRNITVKTLALAIIVLPMLSSCITNKKITLLQDGKKMPQYEQVEYSYYKIQKNDELQIRLLSSNEEASAMFDMNTSTSGLSSNNSRSYRVYEDGTIDIPYISHIPVAGLTVREAAKTIEARIKEYVPDAMVKVGLANDKFYIVAEGNKGAYELYKEKLNIFQALALAGNIASNADRKHVRILRPDIEGKTHVMEFDMRAKSIIGSEYYYIQPNDVIYIGPIKGNFWRSESYAESIGAITTSINFLVSIFNLGITTGLYSK